MDLLISDGDLRVIVFCGKKKLDFFKKEYERKNVIIEGVDMSVTKPEMMLRYLSLACLDTESMKIKRRTEMNGSGTFTAVFLGNRLGRYLTRVLSKILIPRGTFAEYFKKYSPDAVFCTDIQNEFDARLLTDAKALGIKNIGMVRSWDNLSMKGIVKMLPDTLLVNSELVAEEAVALNGMEKEKIRVVGIPHYDNYSEEGRSSREIFFGKLRGDPKKKTILFAPTGDRYLGDNRTDAAVLDILQKEFFDHQIIVRLPPGDLVCDIENRPKVKGTVIDRPSGRFGQVKETELSREDDRHLADTLFYTDVIVSGPSSMCIDSVFWDKPVVLVGFDGSPGLEYEKSIRRFYDYDHFIPVLSSGGVHFVESGDDMVSVIRAYLEKPETRKNGRKRLAEIECGYLDRKSSERLFGVIIEELKK